LLLAKFASNAPNYWSVAAVKLFWDSRVKVEGRKEISALEFANGARFAA
jgi:hypothetical protein